jgi:lipoprotein signal peptidase
MGEVFRLTLGYNTGVAFGMFANGGLAPVVVTGLVILGLIVWFAQALKAGRFPPEAGWPIGLLLGGAIANFADRLFDGRVTDFLDVGLGATRWPTFNLADSAIMIGIAWLLLLNYQRKPRLDPFTPPEEGSSGE